MYYDEQLLLYQKKSQGSSVSVLQGTKPMPEKSPLLPASHTPKTLHNPRHRAEYMKGELSPAKGLGLHLIESCYQTRGWLCSHSPVLTPVVFLPDEVGLEVYPASPSPLLAAPTWLI